MISWAQGRIQLFEKGGSTHNKTVMKEGGHQEKLVSEEGVQGGGAPQIISKLSSEYFKCSK